MSPSKSSLIAARVEGPIVALLDRIRRRETRTRSAQIAHYVREGLIRDGLLVADDEQAVALPFDLGRVRSTASDRPNLGSIRIRKGANVRPRQRAPGYITFVRSGRTRWPPCPPQTPAPAAAPADDNGPFGGETYCSRAALPRMGEVFSMRSEPVTFFDESATDAVVARNRPSRSRLIHAERNAGGAP